MPRKLAFRNRWIWVALIAGLAATQSLGAVARASTPPTDASSACIGINTDWVGEGTFQNTGTAVQSRDFPASACPTFNSSTSITVAWKWAETNLYSGIPAGLADGVIYYDLRDCSTNQTTSATQFYRSYPNGTTATHSSGTHTFTVPSGHIWQIHIHGQADLNGYPTQRHTSQSPPSGIQPFNIYGSCFAY